MWLKTLLPVGYFINLSALFSLTECANMKYCENEKFQGECVEIVVNPSECHKVEKKHFISSIHTAGNCFRLFDKENCEGKSVFAAHGSYSHSKLERANFNFNKKTASISYCFAEDKCYSGNNLNLNWKCRWADEEVNVGFIPRLPRDSISVTPPVVYYQRNETNGRTEYMEALIERHDLSNGSDINDSVQKFGIALGRRSDIAGYILPSSVGGSGTDLRNIFPQTPSYNTAVMLKKVEDLVKETVTSQGIAKFSINLVYSSDSETRPSLIIYRILGPEDRYLFQGSISNE